MKSFIIAMVFVISSESLAAAPIPAQALKDQPVELKKVQDILDKAVKAGKWPGAADEIKLKDAIQKCMERTLRAVEMEERKLPADWTKLEKTDVAAEHLEGGVMGRTVIAGDVQGTSASNSIILATGDVKFTVLSNCIVIGKNVRFTGARGSLVVADELIRGTSARDQPNGKDGSILIAGQWIRMTGASGAVCHVIRPGVNPSPEDKGVGPFTAIRMTSAERVLFLNEPDHIQLNRNRDNTMKPAKPAIAK